MSATASHHRRFLSLPKDYIRRRRAVRRISNAAMIFGLSLVVAYAITGPSGSTGFTVPKSAQETLLASPPSVLQPLSPSAATSPDRAAESSAKDDYKLSNGPFAVSEVPDIFLHDGKRNKDLHVRIFYPMDLGKYPVIVFSHGAGGSQSCCEELTRHWASYGYVTLQPTHDDSTVQRRNSGEEDIRFVRAVNEALKKPALWESRPLDVSFLLDSLTALEKRVPGLTGKIDASHIGVGGHSMGAFTADAIAGALVDLPGHPAMSFEDPRVKAVLMLSPQGPGEFGLTEHSWDNVSVPLLSVTGSLDSGAGHQSPAWRRAPFDHSLPGDKYHLFIEGANHMSFIAARTVLRSRAAQGQAILGYTNSASLAFWDAYLKNDGSAKRYLQSDALAQSSHGAARLSRR